MKILLFLAGVVFVLVACGGDSEGQPVVNSSLASDTDLTEIQAIIDAKVKEAIAALPTPTPVVIIKEVPVEVTTTVSETVPIPTPTPTPTPTSAGTCTLTGGEVVQQGWSGKDTGPNACNQCMCLNAGLACTKMACPSPTPSIVLTPTVTKPESQSRDRLFVRPGRKTGVYPCTEDATRAFASSIVPTHLLTDIEPMGKMAASHVTPTDHLYVHWTPPVSGITDYVVAPADGQIVEISRFPSDKVVRYDNSIIVPDYRMVLMHSCAFATIFIHLAELAPAIAEQTGPIPLGGHWFSTHSRPIEVRAGDPLSKISGTGLDWSVHDADVTLPGFVVPDHYAGEPWKIHTVDPFQYYEEPLRSELLSKVVRTVEPRAGKIDYDVEGTILGNWFLEGTVDYSGNTDDPEYWKGHLAIAYGWIDPSQVRISIGFETGIDDNQLCNVCFSAYGVRGNQPDPVTIGVTAGLVKYELMSRRGPNHEQIGRTALGTFLVQHLGDRTIRVELITNKSPQEVAGFSDAARIYHR